MSTGLFEQRTAIARLIGIGKQKRNKFIRIGFINSPPHSVIDKGLMLGKVPGLVAAQLNNLLNVFQVQ